MLLDDMLVGCWGQLRVDVHTWGAIDQRLTMGDRRMQIIKEPHSTPVLAGHMRRIDELDLGLAADV
jgi:hypothetical protein